MGTNSSEMLRAMQLRRETALVLAEVREEINSILESATAPAGT